MFLRETTMTVLTYFLLVLTTLFWGGTFIAGRILAGQMTPLSASFMRFLIAVITMRLILHFAEVKREKPSARQLLKIVLLGLTGVFSYNYFFFTGLAHISAGRGALIIAMTPLVITIFSTLFLREPLTVVKLFGILLSLTGAVFVISNGHPTLLLSSGFGTGELALMGCVLSWTLYTIIGKSLLKTMSPLVSVYYSALAGMLLLLFPAISDGLLEKLPSIGLQDWSSLIYLGVFGTAVGFSWYYKGVQAIGASRAGIFINLVPVFGTLLSWLILSETLKPSVISGGAMVLTGVFIANNQAMQKKFAKKTGEK